MFGISCDKLTSLFYKQSSFYQANFCYLQFNFHNGFEFSNHSFNIIFNFEQSIYSSNSLLFRFFNNSPYFFSLKTHFRPLSLYSSHYSQHNIRLNYNHPRTYQYRVFRCLNQFSWIFNGFHINQCLFCVCRILFLVHLL